MKRLEEELRGTLPHVDPRNYVSGKFVKGTNIIRFTRYADLGISGTTAALTEGTPPTDQALTIASESFSATQLGATLAITDLALLESPHDLASVGSERLARQAAHTMDFHIREILQAGTSVQYSNGGARSAVSANITGALAKKMFWVLQKNNVPTFSDGTYRAIISPQQAYDLETDTANGGWIDVHKYVDNAPLLSNEIGRIFGTRFMVSSNAKVFTGGGAGGVDVYSAIWFGPDAYVVGDLQTLRAYFVPAGGDHNDPIAQKALMGWKVAFGSMLLDEAGPRYVRLESAGSTL